MAVSEQKYKGYLNMKKKLIGIIGHYDTPNFGDLLLASLVRDAVEESGSRAIIVFGFGPNNKKALFKKLSGLWYALNVNAIVFGGGGYLEGRGRYSIAKHVPFYLASRLAIMRGKKTAVFGAGAGPGMDWLGCQLVSRIINSASEVHLRDGQSMAMAKILGVKNEPKQCVDLAQCIRKRGGFQKIFSTSELPKTRTLLMHADNLFERGTIDGPAKEFCDVLKTAVIPEGWKIEIFFDYLDDSNFLNAISDYTGRTVHFGLSIEKSMELIWLSESVISTKFHVPLVSFTLNKPVWGLSSHPKVEDLFKQYNRGDRYFPGWQGSEVLRKILSDAMSCGNSSEDDNSRTNQEDIAVNLYDNILQFCSSNK